MNLEKKFLETLKKIKISKKEKILVAVSGGKDSAVVLYLLKKFDYNVEGFFIDLCISDYSEKSLKNAKELCEKLNVKLHVYDLKKKQGKSMREIWRKVQRRQKIGNCAVCGVFKKWILNKEARRLGFKKIVTGHNLDDEAQTFLINFLKGNPELSASSGVVTQNQKDKKFIARVKPLFYISEKDVLKYAKSKRLNFVKGKCKYSYESYRGEVREFVNTLTQKEKANLLKNFKRLLRNIRKEKRKINYCEVCSEPTKRNVCKKCCFMK